MSATSCAWIFQTVTISGRIVSQPIGPSGTANAPAVSEALAAALVMAARDSFSASLLFLRELGGTSPTESRIDWPMFEATCVIDALGCFFADAMPFPSVVDSLWSPRNDEPASKPDAAENLARRLSARLASPSRT